jgi:tetratricopeptide (TPR) repeat protein
MRSQTSPTVLRQSVFALLLLVMHGLHAQTGGSISGRVQNKDGSAAVAVPLTLIDEDNPSFAPAYDTTDASGAYHFDHLALGRYHLTTSVPGEAITPDGALALSSPTAALRLDLTVTDISATPSGGAPLQLQTAGIRGYIDPGGYSAAASAAAATDLVRSAANLNQADNRNAAPTHVACSLAPALLRAVAEHPSDATAARRLGQYYLARHEARQAIVSLRHAWALESTDAVTLAALAEALVQDGQFEAAHELIKANATVPMSATMDRILARSEEGLEAFSRAAEDYRNASTLQPTEDDFYGIGYELILAGAPDAAATAFQAGAARYPDSTMMLIGLGTAAFLEGRSAAATGIFLDAAQRHPSDTRIYPFLSASYGISGVQQDAVEAAFRRYYEHAPNDAEAAYAYALSLLHRRQGADDTHEKQAKALLERAVELNPQFSDAYSQLGSVAFACGDYSQAAHDISTALRLNPDLWQLRYKLSAALKRTGHAELAAQQMQTFLALRQQNTATNHISDIHIKQFLSVFRQADAATAKQPSCSL